MIVDAKMRMGTSVLNHFIDLIGFAHIESCNVSNKPRLHGHNASITLSFQSSSKKLDWDYVQNIVSQAKLVVKSFDHVVLLPKHLVSFQENQIEVLVSGKYYSFPKQDVFLLETRSARIDDIASALLNCFGKALFSSAKESFDLTIMLDVSLRFGSSVSQRLSLNG